MNQSKNTICSPSCYNVFWHQPSGDSSGSLPLGNGKIGLNVWLEPSGDLCIYVATGDAWGEFGQLYKLGKLRVRVTDAAGHSPFIHEDLRWGLELDTASVRVRSNRASLRIWVDAHHPCVQVQCAPEKNGGEMQAEVTVEPWRTAARVLSPPERHHFHDGAPYEVFHGADTLCDLPDQVIGWFHHNETSCWKQNLEQQGLLDWAESSGETDPLLHRTFGGILRGIGWRKTDESRLEHPPTPHPFGITVSHLTLCPSTPEGWTAEALKTADRCPAATDESAWITHCAWWDRFWERSYIHIDGNEAARKISRGYALQRFLNACAGRGDYPIKFNGSLFTADWGLPGEAFGPDYRRWGPGYWHQNTRLPYWSMLATGDFEMMRAYFDQYRRILPLSRDTGNGRTFLPAERWSGPPRNVENPELYAVFPYPLCHLASENADTGIRTFKTRTHTHDTGWAQDGMQAARLGLANEAGNSVTKRLIISSAYARFPGFWGPGFDWLPDQDQGGSAAHALQLMLLQTHSGTTHILPAWPEEWSVTARLIAPGNRTVNSHYTPGSPPVVSGLNDQEPVRVHPPQPIRGRVKFPR